MYDSTLLALECVLSHCLWSELTSLLYMQMNMYISSIWKYWIFSLELRQHMSCLRIPWDTCALLLSILLWAVFAYLSFVSDVLYITDDISWCSVGSHLCPTTQLQGLGHVRSQTTSECGPSKFTYLKLSTYDWITLVNAWSKQAPSRSLSLSLPLYLCVCTVYRVLQWVCLSVEKENSRN